MHRQTPNRVYPRTETDRQLGKVFSSISIGTFAIGLALGSSEQLVRPIEAAAQIFADLEQAFAHPLEGISDIRYAPERPLREKPSELTPAPVTTTTSAHQETHEYTYEEPTSINDRQELTKALVVKALENPQKIAWSYEADLCIKGNVVPKRWRSELTISDENGPMFIRPISYIQSDKGIVVCGIERGIYQNEFGKIRHDPHMSRALVVADTSLIEGRVSSFVPCDEYLRTTEDEVIDFNKAASISALAC